MKFDDRGVSAARRAIAFVLGFTLVHMAWSTVERATEWNLPPGTWLDVIALNPAAVVGLASLGAALVWRAWWRPGASVALGLATVVVFGLLYEINGYVSCYYDEDFVFAGAYAFAWVVGRSLGRGLYGEPAFGRLGPAASARVERFGAACALGAVAAVYLSAAVSKLLDSGVWVSADRIWNLALVARHPGGLGWRAPIQDFVLSTRAFPLVASWLTLILEAGAPLLLAGSRWRMVWGTGLVLMHLGIAAVAPLVFETAILSLLALCYPWSRWFPAPVAPAPVGGVPAADPPAVDEPYPRWSWRAVLSPLALFGLVVVTWSGTLEHAERPPLHPLFATYMEENQTGVPWRARQRKVVSSPALPVGAALAGGATVLETAVDLACVEVIARFGASDVGPTARIRCCADTPEHTPAFVRRGGLSCSYHDAEEVPVPALELTLPALLDLWARVPADDPLTRAKTYEPPVQLPPTPPVE